MQRQTGFARGTKAERSDGSAANTTALLPPWDGAAMHPGAGDTPQPGQGVPEHTEPPARGCRSTPSPRPGWDLSKLQPQPQQTPWQFRTCKDQLPFHLGKRAGRQRQAHREH